MRICLKHKWVIVVKVGCRRRNQIGKTVKRCERCGKEIDLNLIFI